MPQRVQNSTIYVIVFSFAHLLLLDSSASREYLKYFVDAYIRMIKGVKDGDRQLLLGYYRALGYLTVF